MTKKTICTKADILKTCKDSIPNDIKLQVVLSDNHDWISIHALYVSKNIKKQIKNCITLPNNLYPEDYTRSVDILYKTLTRKLAQLFAIQLEQDNIQVKGWLRNVLPSYLAGNTGNNFNLWCINYQKYINKEIPNTYFHDYNGLTLGDIEAEYAKERE